MRRQIKRLKSPKKPTYTSATAKPWGILNFFKKSMAGAKRMEMIIPKINQTKTIEIDFKSNMENQRLENDKEVVMYRAACELINNSILHSGASRIEIDLNKHEKFVTLQFYDNGRGFDTSTLTKEDTKGMGLSNIETRVKTVEGVFVLESTPGKGTSALIKMID